VEPYLEWVNIMDDTRLEEYQTNQREPWYQYWNYPCWHSLVIIFFPHHNELRVLILCYWVFHSDTLIVLADGTMKSIKEIEIGDSIRSPVIPSIDNQSEHEVGSVAHFVTTQVLRVHTSRVQTDLVMVTSLPPLYPIIYGILNMSS
jgi:hypothetical protein